MTKSLRPLDDRLTQVPVLSLEECDTVVAEVLALRRLWLKRTVTYKGAGEADGQSYTFYTLGAASYLDRDNDYYEKAATFNSQLERSFGWLYERLMPALADCLKCRVAFEPHAARPGFHIMPPSEKMNVPEGNRHFDMQFLGLKWSAGERMDFSTPMSYTLIIRLPQSGGGLHLWPVTKGEFDAMSRTDRANLDAMVQYVPYQVGSLVCHSGLLLHTSAPTRDMHTGEVRLTLQGHALRCEDTYNLYW